MSDFIRICDHWQYDNTGLKLAQLRFYPVSTTVP